MGPSSGAVALGDLNGDGKLDIVTATYDSSSAVGVLLASGDGKFAAEKEYATGADPVAVALGDLDGDGRLDVVTVNTLDATVSVLLGKGDGTLGTRTDYPTASDTAAVTLGDLDGDGWLDIAVVGTGGHPEGKASVLLGTGGGKFATHVDYTVGIEPLAVAFGDVNGDGKLDLVVANGGLDGFWSLSVLLGKGDGTLAPKVDYPSGPGPQSIAQAEINGDGKLDVVLDSQHGPSSVSVLLGRGDGTFPDKVDYPVNVQSVALADIDGDGKLDIATGYSVLFGAGDGTFPSRLDGFSSGGPFALGDLNGDRRPDLVTTSSTWVNVLLNLCQ